MGYLDKVGNCKKLSIGVHFKTSLGYYNPPPPPFKNFATSLLFRFPLFNFFLPLLGKGQLAQFLTLGLTF